MQLGLSKVKLEFSSTVPALDALSLSPGESTTEEEGFDIDVIPGGTGGLAYDESITQSMGS